MRVFDKRFRLLAHLAAALFFNFCFAANSFDDAMLAIMAKRNIPGMSLAIIEKGTIVKAAGYGVLEFGRADRVTTDTLFQAGSISKVVTAVGALSLVETGKLTLDEDVNNKLRTWHIPEGDLTKEEKVTLRRLLSHTAGVSVDGFPGYAAGTTTPSLIQVLNGEKPANTAPIRVTRVPGREGRYSGGGYVVVQQLIIDVSNQDFPEFMRKAVFDRLGMRVSTFEQPLPANRFAAAATGHTWERAQVPGRWHSYPEMAAAGLWTTPSDLARFAIRIQESLAGLDEDPVIGPSLTRKMLTRQFGNYGLGFGLSGENGSQRFGHRGRDEGFDARLVAYNETRQGAVVMLNCNDQSGAIDEIMSAIAEQYSWPDYPRVRWYDPAVRQVGRLLTVARPGMRELLIGLAATALCGFLMYRLRRRRSRDRVVGERQAQPLQGEG